MRNFDAGLSRLLQSLIRHRELLRRLVNREFSMRYRGSTLGFAWTVLTPLILALIYTFVFANIFKMRWAGTENAGVSDFAIYLLVGLAVHGVFVECLSRAPGLILANTSYITKVVFPLEVLPFVILITALMNSTISLAIAALINLSVSGHFHLTVFFAPLLLVPFALFVASITMIVAAVGVYLRDLSQITTLIIPISLFLTPIFYPIEAVPRAMRPFMAINPMTFAVEQARAVLIKGELPNFGALAVYTAAAIISLSAAFWIFQRLRKGFADVV